MSDNLRSPWISAEDILTPSLPVLPDSCNLLTSDSTINTGWISGTRFLAEDPLMQVGAGNAGPNATCSDLAVFYSTRAFSAPQLVSESGSISSEKSKLHWVPCPE